MDNLNKLLINPIIYLMIHTKMIVKVQIHFFELVITSKIHDSVENDCTNKHVADKLINKKVGIRHMHLLDTCTNKYTCCDGCIHCNDWNQNPVKVLQGRHGRGWGS